MSRRAQNRVGSRIPRAELNYYFLHRRPAQWDVLVWEIAQTLNKRLAAKRSLLGSAGLPLSDSAIPSVAIMLARGFDAAMAAAVRRDPELAQAVDDASFDEPFAARLVPLLAVDCYEPLLRRYGEDSADRFLPRPQRQLEEVAHHLAAATADLILTRCGPEGDLRRSILSPVEDATGIFPDNDRPADPPAGSGRASVDIQRLQVNIHESDNPVEVKRRLLDFILACPWLSAALSHRLASADQRYFLSEDTARADATDKFVYTPTRLEGKTPIELLIEQQPDMPEVQRQRLARWTDESFTGVFLIQGTEGHFTTLRDVRDQQEYHIWTPDPDVFAELPLGALMLTRLTPWDDHWIFSGPQELYERIDERQMKALVRLLPGEPRRSAAAGGSDPLEQKARELQLEQYQAWVQLFGTDEVLFDDGRKLGEAIHRFHHHLQDDVVNPEAGLVPAQARERTDMSRPPQELPLLPHYLQSDDVAVLMDPLIGMSIVEGYGLFRSTFASDKPPTAEQLRRVWDFLRRESIEPAVFLRMRERFPQRTEEVMRLVLRDRLFQLDRDFEPTLRKFKGRAMRRPPTPRITVVHPADLEAMRT